MNRLISSHFRLWHLLCVVCALAIVGYFFIFLSSSCRRLSCVGIEHGSKWTLDAIYEEKPGVEYRAMYKDMGTNAIFRVDVKGGIDAATATDYIRGRIASMKALYDNLRSPYPGFLSNEIVCDSEYKPTYQTIRSKSGVTIEQITGYLNDRMTFGSCMKDQAVHKGVVLLFSCPKRNQLYQLEIISLRSKFSEIETDTIVRSITCL